MACCIGSTLAPARRGALVVALVTSLACAPTTDLDDDDGSSSGAETGASSGATSDSSVTATTELADASGSTLGGTSEGGTCGLPPVEQAELDQLSIVGNPSGYVAAGTSAPLALGWVLAGTPSEVEACVEWSVEPVSGVSIDQGGLLAVEAAVPVGTIITVTADVESGRRVIQRPFQVYEPLAYDIIGFWTELQQLPCDGGAPFEPDPEIGELVFEDTGELSVTWRPFEVYYDYWGTYTYDEATGALVLEVEGGNYVPDDLDLEGTASVVDGQLVLEDLWLGTAQQPVTPAACGHVFE